MVIFEVLFQTSIINCFDTQLFFTVFRQGIDRKGNIIFFSSKVIQFIKIGIYLLV